MKPVQVVLLVSALLIWKPAVAGDERTAPFPGCYQLDLGRWRTLWVFPATPAPNQVPPPTFELGVEPIGRAGLVGFRIEPNPHRPAGLLDSWAPEPGEPDAVTIRWSNGFSGVSLHLKADGGDRLRGHAKVFTDAIDWIPDARARAFAVRKSCGEQ
jgi:hypothetical protein